MGSLRVSRAMRHAIPAAADNSYEPGDQVLIWREKQVNNRIGEWLGPHTVLQFNPNRKLVYIQDKPVGAPRPFNITQVRKYQPPDELALMHFADLHRGLQYFSSTDNEEDLPVYLTEIISPSDPRASSKEMTDAKRKEIKGLLERGTFKVYCEKRFLPTPMSFPAASYSQSNPQKTRSSVTVQPSSIRLILSLAALFDFDVWTSDVTQAYLQSSVPLMRDVYITKHLPEFELEAHQCLKLLKPLYGLCDSGDLWHRTIDEHHRLDLGMKATRSDPALYTLLSEDKLIGLSGGYVDDLLRAGTPAFRKLSQQTHKKFDMGADESPPCAFSGFLLSRDRDGNLQQHQKLYLKQLETLPLDATF
eukprot:IDg22143t1